MRFPDIVGPTATGTGTARTSINATYQVPSIARALVAVQPLITASAPATAESVLAILDFIGKDCTFQPCELPFPVGGSKLGAIDTPHVEAPRWFPVNAPLTGNEVWDVGVEPLDAMAGNGLAGANLIFDTVEPNVPLIKTASTRETATGTGTGEVTGSTITLSNASKIIELGGAVTGSTVAADQEHLAYMTLKSTGFHTITEHKFFLDAVQAIDTGTSGVVQTHLMRVPVDIDITVSSCVITSAIYITTAFATAGQFFHYMRYI